MDSRPSTKPPKADLVYFVTSTSIVFHVLLFLVPLLRREEKGLLSTSHMHMCSSEGEGKMTLMFLWYSTYDADLSTSKRTL